MMMGSVVGRSLPPVVAEGGRLGHLHILNWSVTRSHSGPSRVPFVVSRPTQHHPSSNGSVDWHCETEVGGRWARDP